MASLTVRASWDRRAIAKLSAQVPRRQREAHCFKPARNVPLDICSTRSLLLRFTAKPDTAAFYQGEGCEQAPTGRGRGAQILPLIVSSAEPSSATVDVTWMSQLHRQAVVTSATDRWHIKPTLHSATLSGGCSTAMAMVHNHAWLVLLETVAKRRLVWKSAQTDKRDGAKVLLICASCHENAYNTCIVGSVPDMAVFDWEVPVSDTLGTRYYGSITGTSSCPIKAADSAACVSGHGGTAEAMSPVTRLLFLEQVGFYSYYGYKNDNRFIVVLPCPKVLYLSFASLCLLLSGDIETNPGPNTTTLLKELLDGQQAIKTDLAALSERIKEVEKTVRAVRDQAKVIAELTKTNKTLNASVKTLHDRLVSLEDRSRRNNLMVFGIPEGEKETTEELSTKVLTDLFDKQLNVSLHTVERIHRIGKRQSKQPRPVILKLYDSREKLKVYKNCKKLKGTGISIADDYSKETVTKRKLLWNSAQDERKQGKRVRLDYDKMFIDGDMYSWDDEKNRRVKLRRNKSTLSAVSED
ncbi:uncharacterized protein [Dermacentor albipictus]|uniref:uncharacterized protein isoform X3 n=1 Tax=Dermacentor albipictus TaxID=60249 RepID=UPI0038FC79D4